MLCGLAGATVLHVICVIYLFLVVCLHVPCTQLGLLYRLGLDFCFTDLS